MIPLQVPVMPSEEELVPLLSQIDDNRQYSQSESLLRELERQLAECLSFASGLPISAVTCQSGGSAIALALRNCGLAPGSKILTPALGYSATAEAIIRAGFQPLFADIDSHTLCLSPAIALLALKQHPDIAAIVPVATYGMAHDCQAWDEFIDQTKVPVIIDAADAIGNQLVGKKVMVTFSLHASNVVSTGEGGLIAASDATFIQAIRHKINVDSDNNTAAFSNHNEKLDEHAAAIGLCNFNNRDEKNRVLVHRRYEYLRHLEKYQQIRAQPFSPAHSTTVFVLMIDMAFDNKSLQYFLQSHQIESRLWHCPLLPNQPEFQHCAKLDLPNANYVVNHLVGLPMHVSLTAQDVKRVVTKLIEFLRLEKVPNNIIPMQSPSKQPLVMKRRSAAER